MKATEFATNGRGNLNATLVAYADDMAINALDDESLQHNLDVLAAGLAALGLTLSVKKTEVMRIIPDPAEADGHLTQAQTQRIHEYGKQRRKQQTTAAATPTTILENKKTQQLFSCTTRRRKNWHARFPDAQ